MTDRGQIYLVFGSHGEYSDYKEWNVAAFTKKDRATIFRDLVQRKYNAARASYKAAEDAVYESCEPEADFIVIPDAEQFAFPEDPQAPIESSYEATYTVTPVPLNPKF